MAADWLRSGRVKALVVIPLLAGLVVGALAVLAVISRPVEFESRALVLVDQPGGLAASADGAVIDKLLRLRVKYSGLVITDRIAGPVAETLGIPIEDVRGHLVGMPVENTTLVAVLGTDEDKERARELAQAAAEQLAEDTRVDQAQFLVAEDQAIVVSIVTPAQEPEKQDASVGRLVGIGVVSGGLTAVLVGVTLAALRPRP